MPSNTFYSDVNEIWFGYCMNNEKWFDKEAEKQFKSRLKSLDPKLTALQMGRAAAMAVEVKKWAKLNGYSGIVKNVHWTARPGSMSRIVKREVDQRKNPTDILVQFTKGPADGFLGVSAKSTHGSGDIGFKNPGMGTVENTLKVDLSTLVDKVTQDTIKKFKLPESTSGRKEFLRARPAIQAKTQEIGSGLLSKIRDAMYGKLKTLNQKELKNYLLQNWLNADTALYPPYIKATVIGKDEKTYKAKIDDPLKNDKLATLLKAVVKLEKVGNESIGVTAGTMKIMKMRAKFESEKMASSIKMTGDPW